MATTAKKNAEDDKRQQQADEYREVLANAYTFVNSQKVSQSFAALTPEDLMDRFIERIEGKDTQARPNVLNRIAKLRNEVTATIAKVKALPASTFRKKDDKTDVNTDPAMDDASFYGNEVTSANA